MVILPLGFKFFFFQQIPALPRQFLWQILLQWFIHHFQQLAPILNILKRPIPAIENRKSFPPPRFRLLERNRLRKNPGQE